MVSFRKQYRWKALSAPAREAAGMSTPRCWASIGRLQPEQLSPTGVGACSTDSFTGAPQERPKYRITGVYGMKDSKPNNKQGGQGGMVPQKPKPPIKGGNTGGTPGGSYNKGKPTHPTGGGGSVVNKKPTP